MKSASLIFVVFIALASKTFAQDTFSIVAADSSTREVGSAGASCVDLFLAGISDATFIGDLLPDTGAINTQAYYLSSNQYNARERMRAGDSPEQMITWLIENDWGSNPDIRQYGIVGFTGTNLSAAAYTGVDCNDYKAHKTGSINGIYYSIQGNILLGQQIIDSMESKFRTAQGDLACRLMAALQGANVVGADTRCDDNNSSSLFAYVKVAQPTDSYGNPSFSLSVKTHDGDQVEPIDSLQTLFNAQHNCSSGIHQAVNKTYCSIHPNPTSGKITVTTTDQRGSTTISIITLQGKELITEELDGDKTNVDLGGLPNGIYFYQVNNHYNLQRGKIILQ